MLTFHSPDTQLRRVQTELHGGELIAPFERPERVELILERIQTAHLGEVREPAKRGLEGVLAVHDVDYVRFLETVWEQWVAAGYQGEVIPSVWPARSMRSDVRPDNLKARIGYYAMAAETSISAGTFEAALASKDTALAAVDHVIDHVQPAFGLCRPPGHHAATNQYGGYCFFNNAAIAAQHARERGVERVAILDIDFHHGNGTQEIFYGRDDVLFLSLHGDPRLEFPFFLGYADEIGRGRGEGYNVNYPLAPGTDYRRWSQTLDDALDRIGQFDAELLIVSLGVDTFENDPISSFVLKHDDYRDCGQRLRQAGIPTTFLMEGGYAVKEIGINVVNVLKGFEEV